MPLFASGNTRAHGAHSLYGSQATNYKLEAPTEGTMALVAVHPIMNIGTNREV